MTDDTGEARVKKDLSYYSGTEKHKVDGVRRF